jgi:hypothetical protein
MTSFRRTSALIVALTLSGCERAKTPPLVETTAVRPVVPTDSAARMTALSWDPSAGPVLLVSSEDPAQARVVVPDTASAASTLAALPHPAEVTLFSRSGTVQTALLPSVAPAPNGCVVATLDAAPPPKPWSVGFVGGVISPVAIDSIESISHADSASYIVWMNRLASALPNESAGRFTGLPFVVRALWRVNVPSGAPVVIGALDRHLNQEATPLQERTFLVAEGSPSDSSYTTVYSERSFGPEETIQNQELLAAALLGSTRNLALIIARDFGDATAYALIERGDDGRWHQRWLSPRRQC